MEIGASAFQLQNVVNQRKDVLEGRTRIRRIDDPDGDDEVDEDNMPVYPRSMLRLELSDGRNKIKAMEYRRLDGLKLGETPLGCKVSFMVESVFGNSIYLDSCCSNMCQCSEAYVSLPPRNYGSDPKPD